jgi:hypothetical protein
MNILFAMHDAKFVHINDHVLVTQYCCDPEDFLVADDIVHEAENAEGRLELTLDEVRDATQVGPDTYRLRSGLVITLVTPPTIH